jgi:hypothetical protein
VLVASAPAYVAGVRRLVPPFRLQLALQPHGLLVGSLLAGPPLVVFALALVVSPLARVDFFLLEVASPLLSVVRELPAPLRPALALE